MKNVMANATIEAAIKRFWDFVKNLKIRGSIKELSLWIRRTDKGTEVNIMHSQGAYFTAEYEDETITVDDFENYFDSQDIPILNHNRNFDTNGRVYTTSLEVRIPEDISEYAPDEKVTDTMLVAFTYSYSKDKKMVFTRIDNPDTYPEKINWNEGEVTIHCYVVHNSRIFIGRAIRKEVEKITPKFVEMGRNIYGDEDFFNQKMKQFQEQTENDLFLRGWIMQKTMKNWEKILKNKMDWKMGDIMMDSYKIYGLED